EIRRHPPAAEASRSSGRLHAGNHKKVVEPTVPETSRQLDWTPRVRAFRRLSRPVRLRKRSLLLLERRVVFVPRFDVPERRCALPSSEWCPRIAALVAAVALEADRFGRQHTWLTR